MFSDVKECAARAVYNGLAIALALVLAGCFHDEGGDDGPDPDLMISELSVGNVIGVPIPFSITYANTGGRNATGFQIRLYLSTDQTLDEGSWRAVISPSEVSRVVVAPGETKTLKTSISYPPIASPGPWYVIAKIDSDNAVAESDENNNIFVSDLLQLRRAAPDLTISGLTLTANAGATTRPFNAIVDIENRGEIVREGLQISLYLSNDLAWSGDDLSIGELLDPLFFMRVGYTGQAVVKNAIVPEIPFGPRYIIAVIDKDNVVNEVDETNNVYVLSTPIDVHDGVSPQVKAKTPAPNSVDLPYDTTVTATFDETMDAASIQGGTTSNPAGTAQIVLGTDVWNTSVSYDAAALTATITPNIPLIGGYTYQAVFTDGITDAAGNGLIPVSWDFTTKTHFSANGQSSYSHMGGHAILLDSGPNLGKVLVFGGMARSVIDGPTSGTGVATEMYDPATGLFSPVSPAMRVPRHRYAAATKMPSGNVLVTGGYFFDDFDGTHNLWPTTDVFDAATTLWAPGPDLKYARIRHQVVSLGDGTALVSGGISVAATQSAPVFPLPAYTEIITENSAAPSVLGPPLITPRYDHTATVLNDGKVLIAGGYDANNMALASAEIYDPATNEITDKFTDKIADKIVEVSYAMTTPRGGAQAVLLDTGNVLLIGGATKTETGWVALKTVEVFDPATGKFAAVADEMAFPRANFSAVKLADGKVLIVGGERLTAQGEVVANATAEVFDPATKKFSSHDAVDPAWAQVMAPSVALSNGNAVVFAGGLYGTSSTDPTVRILSAKTMPPAYIFQPDPPAP